MEKIKMYNLGTEASRIGLGTWAIGGWMWGGTDEEESVKTIRTAIDKGINLIDTAPVYGFGKSEEIVGKALKEHGKREEVILVTKVGLDWDENGKVFRNSTRTRINQEIDDSLRRLQTDYLDVYMIHWPDPNVPLIEVAESMYELMARGKIRSIGVSNYDPEQMDEFRKTALLHVSEPPFNLFERQIEEGLLPYCQKNKIITLAYGALCRGLLSGKMSKDREFKGDDLRKVDPKFKDERFDQYLKAVEELDRFARERYNKGIIHLAVRWMLDKGADVALWGARSPEQLDVIDEVFGWNIDVNAMVEIDKAINAIIEDPVGPEFMAPPAR